MIQRPGDTAIALARRKVQMIHLGQREVMREVEKIARRGYYYVSVAPWCTRYGQTIAILSWPPTGEEIIIIIIFINCVYLLFIY